MQIFSQDGPSPLGQALSRRVLRQSAMVAIVVGSILNLINQGDAILYGGAINPFKLALTYIVPFLVSTYGAWSMARTIDKTS